MTPADLAPALTGAAALAALPGPAHQPARVVELAATPDTPAPVLLHQCACGRGFTADGLARHLIDSAAALAATTDPTAPRRTA